MSFTFPSWSTAFSPSFHEDAKAMLEGALNKGSKPPVIQGKIEVVELSMGKQPPTLTLLEIGDLSLERFRGIFRLGYQGDAWLEVRCRVQANPLSHNPHLAAHATLPMNAPLLASQPLLVPMTLRLSSLNLRAILILVVSKSKGITLVFKNDPLQNVDVSSTFDSVEVIRGYLQQEIEGQLREMFREDLPGIIHRLSQQWFAGTGVGGRVEMPYRNETLPIEASQQDDLEDPAPEPINSFSASPARPTSGREEEGMSTSPTTRRKNSMRAHRKTASATSTSDSPSTYSTYPENEHYDPTYGLRPEGLPTHSGYEAFGKLFDKVKENKRKGLGSLMDLAEEASIGPGMAREDEDALFEGSEDDEEYEDPGDLSDDTEDGGQSVDLVDSSPALRSRSRSRPSRYNSSMMSPYPQSRTGMSTDGRSLRGESVEFETIAAVGGGTISRPRIFHVQSQIRAPSEAGYAGSVFYSPSGTLAAGTAGSVTARASSVMSSAGGSQIGMRPARSVLTQTGRFAPHRGGMSRIDAMSSMNTRPTPTRQNSRAESVPAFPTGYRPVSGNRNMVAYAAMNNRSMHNGSAMYGNGDDGSRSVAYSHRPSTSTSGEREAKPPALVSQPVAKFITPPRPRRSSLSQNPAMSGSPPSWPIAAASKPNNIVVPLNESVSQLATLYQSNHTLSPYARNNEHVAVRSFPHLSRTSSIYSVPTSLHGQLSGAQQGQQGFVSHAAHHHQVTKGQRKRIYRLNKPAEEGSGTQTPVESPGEADMSAELAEMHLDGGRRAFPPSNPSVDLSSAGSNTRDVGRGQEMTYGNARRQQRVYR